MKKQNVLITPTLLDSFDFALGAPPSWKERAMKDFIGKIRREKMTFPPWVQRGIEFEDAVYDTCRRTRPGIPITNGSDKFKQVCEAVRGGTFQTVFKKTLIIDDLPVLLYNKTDVAFPDMILDIKTTLKWKGENKYLSKWQHKLYTYSSGKSEFQYLIVQWESETSSKIKDIFYIPYTAPNFVDLEDEIVSHIRVLFDYLKRENLYDDYFHTFSNNKR